MNIGEIQPTGPTLPENFGDLVKGCRLDVVPGLESVASKNVISSHLETKSDGATIQVKKFEFVPSYSVLRIM